MNPSPPEDTMRRPALTVRAYLLALVALGCGDGAEPEDTRLSGTWAGSEWLGRSEALLVTGAADGDTLYLFGARPVNADLPDEVLRVRVAYEGPGVYQLDADAVEYAVYVGGDVVTAVYSGKTPMTGTLQVLSDRGEITGKLEFDAQAATEFQPYGSAPRFADGQFRAILRADSPVFPQ